MNQIKNAAEETKSNAAANETTVQMEFLLKTKTAFVSQINEAKKVKLVWKNG